MITSHYCALGLSAQAHDPKALLRNFSWYRNVFIVTYASVTKPQKLISSKYTADI